MSNVVPIFAQKSVSVVCDTCDDLGWVTRNVAIDHPDFGHSFPCPHCELGRAEMRRKRQRHFGDAGIPSRLFDYDLEAFNTLPNTAKKGKRLAISLANVVSKQGFKFSIADVYAAIGYEHPDTTPRWGAVIAGSYGTGKTALAVAIANALTRPEDVIVKAEKPESSASFLPGDYHYADMVFMRTERLLSSIQAGYSNGNSDKLLEQVIKAKFVILDDFNIEQWTPDKRRIATEIIRARYDHVRPTLFTCNVSQSEMEANVGAWMVSALNEMAMWVQMDGQVLRPEAAMFADPDDL